MENKWPKHLPELTAQQTEIKRDFMKYWHEVLPKRYGLIERFNHGYPLRGAKPGGKVLEIGAGLGEHIAYENLTDTEYYAVELLPDMAEVIKRRFPGVTVIVGDCQKRLNFPDQYFDRVVAIHVLEHLPNLPAALNEISRLLKPTGEFRAVIPCEGGLTYALARRISARRIFEKRYRQSYDWCIKSEHINMAVEVLEELPHRFRVVKRSFFPLFVPSIQINLVIGLTLKPLQ
ncbi:hypothetical protein A3G55_00695 [Candidatus Giovannonibacteria bacterium RIFCSPLOWO2_12_FULL_44_25]|uniref:Methyltransferase type 11 domain-containing protein n=2 Tax=Candidatus Giovannoniibacteriota TaxID=1752738 RepID=A0A1F5WAZ2_9BACT|nr:MAG: Methyltransferase 24 [Parcubacteria group bacterium GW2011_GWC1_44_10]KKT60453.1 MAG: Methyltransferase 24 [Candidatus Giovannonibacteria bacterium GW2011_GWA1_44_25]KKU30311.1 MAG: Methyltransferase 24 [Candidatus Giovannonibacteria bacterium GW2011_GWB1_46_20]OGF50516.1 MAG: hypothetical protein A2120_02630 [Candidatus Giovannonibacteria bacterium GWA2_45_15]OGF59649.1 MAG: hypothetical protein A2W40_04525 [Candidatus Giovannonibacteria bacterium RIFCSPHIGHO2_01_45_12]OGF60390.1 MAG: